MEPEKEGRIQIGFHWLHFWPKFSAKSYCNFRKFCAVLGGWKKQLKKSKIFWEKEESSSLFFEKRNPAKLFFITPVIKGCHFSFLSSVFLPAFKSLVYKFCSFFYKTLLCFRQMGILTFPRRKNEFIISPLKMPLFGRSPSLLFQAEISSFWDAEEREKKRFFLFFPHSPFPTNFHLRPSSFFEGAFILFFTARKKSNSRFIGLLLQH